MVSETRERQPDVRVLAFLASLDSAGLFVSVLTLGEPRKGVAAKRRTDPAAAREIEAWADGVEIGFADRVLPIDAATARIWGEPSSGRSVPVIDTLIAAAALAHAHGLTLVTRDTRDVETTGVPLVDPWRTPGSSTP